MYIYTVKFEMDSTIAQTKKDQALYWMQNVHETEWKRLLVDSDEWIVVRKSSVSKRTAPYS